MQSPGGEDTYGEEFVDEIQRRGYTPDNVVWIMDNSCFFQNSHHVKNGIVSYDYFRSSGAAFGLHAGAGLRVPVSDDLSVTLEGRYNFADEVGMGDDFDQNRIDVSGIAATVGVRLRF